MGSRPTPAELLFDRATSVEAVTVTAALCAGGSLLVQLGDGRSIAFTLRPMPVGVHELAAARAADLCSAWASARTPLEMAVVGALCAIRDRAGHALVLPTPS